MLKNRFTKSLKKYRFEIRHITILLIVLISFQILLALIQNTSLDDFLSETQSWYQRFSAERLATVTSTSLELLFENMVLENTNDEKNERKIIAAFNVVFKQQLIQKSVEKISLIIVKNHRLHVIDTGQKLYNYMTENLSPWETSDTTNLEVVELFRSEKNKMKSDEVIFSNVVDGKTFNILVPFVPDGEYLGVMYMKITPDFSFLSNEVSANFSSVAIIYSSLIFLGLIGIFLVSSQAVKERNEAQEKLFEEHEDNLKKEIRLEKESLFTRRIYHTHHKAEKIMGYIKSDVRSMDSDNLEEYRKRVITYSNFISRIIYDMKWYEQDVNTIINPMFQTDINDVIRFIVEHVFLRISSKNEMFSINLNLAENIPAVPINEFIVWEILEPIIQNSIDHGKKKKIDIIITTSFDPNNNRSKIVIEDNGVGIRTDLLDEDENGIQKLFLENVSNKRVEGQNSGYGCYISHQLAVERCAWQLEAKNLDKEGCAFSFIIKN